MSSPYRDAEIPSDVVQDTEVAPLARFDVSGAAGANGQRGHYGAPGQSTGATGEDGDNATIAQPGENAGMISLELVADDAAGSVKLSGHMVLARGEKREVRNLFIVGEAGTIELAAFGGDGGTGGNGGVGGAGARGANGANATRWSSGSDGSMGGNGGRGGNATSGARAGDGGNLVITVADADTPLLMLLHHDISGGTGGAKGVNGAGGIGGTGGSGGGSYSWTTTSTSRNSDGSSTTHTHYHSNPGGSDGSPGFEGEPGNARVVAGCDGEPGTLSIRVVDGDNAETYNARYDLRLVSFSHDSLDEDAVYEPRELVRVFDLEVENVGGMPTPRKDDLALVLARAGWVRPELGELRCQRGLAPGERYKVPGELRFRIADHTPSGPSDPLEIEETILQRAMLPSVHRDFAAYQVADAVQQGKFVIRYPVRLSPVTNLKSLAAGEATRVRFSLTNQSRFALGAAADCKRVVRVRVSTAPDSELGDEYVELVVGAQVVAPQEGWTHELSQLDAGEEIAVEIVVRVRPGAPEYRQYVAHVALELGDIETPASPRQIQVRELDVRVARPFAVSDADVLLVVNHRTSREEIEAWEQVGERRAFTTALWDLSREGHLDLERPLEGGISLAAWFERKAIVILDNPIASETGETYPHVFLADDQAARVAAAGLDIALIGKGMALTRMLIPSVDSASTPAPIYRRFWLRWWAKPTEPWLFEQAGKMSAALCEEKPTERHLVIYRFEPEIEKSAWSNRWKVGTIHTIRTLDVAQGGIVQAEATPADVHDPAYITSPSVARTLLAMFGFEENLERMRRLLARAAVADAELDPVIDALVLDLANELAAAIAPGWTGDAPPVGERLARLERLGETKLVTTYATVGGRALLRLAGRVLFLGGSQVSWWEVLPPFRWMRRSPSARSLIAKHVETFLAAAFDATNVEQAMKEAQHIADDLTRAYKTTKRSRLASVTRRTWALEEARKPIAEPAITSDTEVLTHWEDRVLAGSHYDTVMAARAADALARTLLVGNAQTQHAELFVPRTPTLSSRT